MCYIYNNFFQPNYILYIIFEGESNKKLFLDLYFEILELIIINSTNNNKLYGVDKIGCSVGICYLFVNLLI